MADFIKVWGKYISLDLVESIEFLEEGDCMITMKPPRRSIMNCARDEEEAIRRVMERVSDGIHSEEPTT